MRILCIDLSMLFTMRWEVAQGGRLEDASAATVAEVTRLRDGWDVVVAACDAVVADPDRGWKSAPSVRLRIDPIRDDPEKPGDRLGYKANRPNRGAPYYEQIRRTRERLSADGCHVFVAPEVNFDEKCPACSAISDGAVKVDCSRCKGAGFITTDNPSGYFVEADDVIAWVAKCYGDAAEADIAAGGDPTGWALRIVSSDLDVAQCIDDMLAIDMLHLHAGKVMRWEDIRAKHGVDAAKIADLKALMGDASDDYKPYPGARKADGKRGPGIGEKAAQSLLSHFGDALSAVRACLAEPPPNVVPPAIVALIRKHGIKAAQKGLDLARLKWGLPLDFAPVLKGPAPIKSIARPTDDDDERAAIAGEPVSEAAAPRVVPADHPWGQAQGPFSEGLQAAWREAGLAPLPSGPLQTLAEPVVAGMGEERGPVVVPPATPAQSAPSPAPVVVHGAGAADGSIGSALRATAASVARVELRAADAAVEVPRVEVVTPAAMVVSGRNERFELSPYGLEPPSMKDAFWLATKLADGRMFPKIGSAEQYLTVILMGRARGFAALTALENAYVVGGGVAWKSAFIVGSVLASGFAAYLEIEETSVASATAITKRVRGGTGKDRRLTFTIEEAKAMGYLDPPQPGKHPGSWHKQPAVMLRWRVQVALARMVYPDIVGGMHDPSELRSDGSMTDEEAAA